MVYMIDGNFLVFENQHARALRRNRIVGNLIGCSPKNPYQIITSSLPLKLSKYEVDVIVRKDLAKFVKLVKHPETSLESCRTSYSAYLDELAERAQKEYRQSRVAELNKRNIPISDSNIKQIDTTRMKVPIPNTPDARFSTHAIQELLKEQVHSYLGSIDKSKRILFQDLYNRGFYITSGLKYGSEFLAYFGDPVAYHAQYALRIVAGDGHGNVNLTFEDFNEINSLYRLCHTANKVSLLVTVNSEQITYWTLRHREFLTSSTDSSSLERHDPRVPIETVMLDSDSPGTMNKVIKR